ncbi:efflux pump protein [Periconia macrospinosa]|uniref:Efflux pump protein n=1 Tax=Periconia macrospinosa TaxID=97972 RepID=A0A2V1DAN7_9PLEO|nr:efflux pump protein [Periconia macrospinosa]
MTTNAIDETVKDKQVEPSTKDDAAQTPSEEQYLTGIKMVLLLASVTIVAFLFLLDISIVSTAIPQITAQFHSLKDVGWYSGAYLLTCAAFQPLSGKFYTYMRNKDVFLAHLFIFELGSLICGVATSSAMLIGGRSIAGVGGAGLMNGCITLIGRASSLDKRPLYTGIVLGFAQLGLISGPLLGGALTEHATWRWCFYINLPVGGIAAVVILVVNINDPNSKTRYTVALFRKMIPLLDLPGFALFAPCCVMLLLALQFGGVDHPWDSATVIGLLVGSGVLLVLFIIWEARTGEDALIPKQILKGRVLITTAVYQMSISILTNTTSLWMPVYFQAVKGVGPTASGVNTLPSILSQMLLAVVGGAAISKLGYYLPWGTLGGVLGAIGYGLMSMMDASTSTAAWAGYLFLSGSGRGAAMQVPLVAAQNAVPPKLIPTSLAFLIFAQSLSGSVFIVVANTIFNQSLKSTLPKYAPSVSLQQALDAGASASAINKLLENYRGETDGVLKAYSESLSNIWLLATGFSGLMFLMSFGMGWVDVRKKKEWGEEKKVDSELKTESSEGEKQEV